jgi:cytochrome c oxidase assembly protein subunit 15
MSRYAILLAVCTLLLLMSGAAVTDYNGVAKPPDWLIQGHQVAAMVVRLLTFGLIAWMSLSAEPVWLRGLGWIALVLCIADFTFATRSLLLVSPVTIPAPLSRTASILHAFLAQIFFATTVAVRLFTSNGWKRGAEPVKDQGWPSLRSLSSIALFLVLLQVWLGIAFRHQAAGLMPHIVGALTVALVILILCMFVMQQFPEHRSLRPAANALLAILVLQVVFGISALTARMMAADNTLPTPLLLTTVAHVAMGAVTLALTLVLVIQIRRNVNVVP